ncbi:MAG: hypothetical protein ACLQFT_03990 [Steroidobacteraceae bacterium]
MTDYKITPQTGYVPVSPFGFHDWALQYLKCRRSFLAPAGYSPVPYFLLCHAIELELKARLLEAQGWPPKVDLMKKLYGHDLMKAYNALPNHQQILTASEIAVLAAANKIYSSKGFEYFQLEQAVGGFTGVPSLAALDAVAEKLLPT